MFKKILKWTSIVFVGLIVAVLASIYIPNSLSPELGIQNGLLTPLKDSPNGVSTQTSDISKQVQPWPMKSTSESTMSAIFKSLENYRDNRVKIIEQTDTYLRVVFVTPQMRYRDDAEFYIDEEDQVVHFRSNSRVGQGDMGLNKQRYETLSLLYLATD